MALTTTNFGIPYPEITDTTSVKISTLADAFNLIDTLLISVSNTSFLGIGQALFVDVNSKLNVSYSPNFVVNGSNQLDLAPSILNTIQTLQNKNFDLTFSEINIETAFSPASYPNNLDIFFTPGNIPDVRKSATIEVQNSLGNNVVFSAYLIKTRKSFDVHTNLRNTENSSYDIYVTLNTDHGILGNKVSLPMNLRFENPNILNNLDVTRDSILRVVYSPFSDKFAVIYSSDLNRKIYLTYFNDTNLYTSPGSQVLIDSNVTLSEENVSVVVKDQYVCIAYTKDPGGGIQPFMTSFDLSTFAVLPTFSLLTAPLNGNVIGIATSVTKITKTVLTWFVVLDNTLNSTILYIAKSSHVGPVLVNNSLISPFLNKIIAIPSQTDGSLVAVVDAFSFLVNILYTPNTAANIFFDTLFSSIKSDYIYSFLENGTSQFVVYKNIDNLGDDKLVFNQFTAVESVIPQTLINFTLISNSNRQFIDAQKRRMSNVVISSIRPGKLIWQRIPISSKSENIPNIGNPFMISESIDITNFSLPTTSSVSENVVNWNNGFINLSYEGNRLLAVRLNVQGSGFPNPGYAKIANFADDQIAFVDIPVGDLSTNVKLVVNFDLNSGIQVTGISSYVPAPNRVPIFLRSDTLFSSQKRKNSIIFFNGEVVPISEVFESSEFKKVGPGIIGSDSNLRADVDRKYITYNEEGELTAHVAVPAGIANPFIMFDRSFDSFLTTHEDTNGGGTGNTDLFTNWGEIINGAVLAMPPMNGLVQFIFKANQNMLFDSIVIYEAATQPAPPTGIEVLAVNFPTHVTISIENVSPPDGNGDVIYTSAPLNFVFNLTKNYVIRYITQRTASTDELRAFVESAHAYTAFVGLSALTLDDDWSTPPSPLYALTPPVGQQFVGFLKTIQIAQVNHPPVQGIIVSDQNGRLAPQFLPPNPIVGFLELNIPFQSLTFGPYIYFSGGSPGSLPNAVIFQQRGISCSPANNSFTLLQDRVYVVAYDLSFVVNYSSSASEVILASRIFNVTDNIAVSGSDSMQGATDFTIRNFISLHNEVVIQPLNSDKTYRFEFVILNFPEATPPGISAMSTGSFFSNGITWTVSGGSITVTQIG